MAWRREMHFVGRCCQKMSFTTPFPNTFFSVALVLSLLSLSVLRTEWHTWQIVPSGVSGRLLKITLPNAALILYVSCRHYYEWDGYSTFRLHCPHCCTRRDWNGKLKYPTFASHEPKGWAGGMQLCLQHRTISHQLFAFCPGNHVAWKVERTRVRCPGAWEELSPTQLLGSPKWRSPQWPLVTVKVAELWRSAAQ